MKSVVYAVLTLVVSAPLFAALLFFPVMFLAGPHSSLLPAPLQAAVVTLCALAIVGVPAWLAVKVFRRCEARRVIRPSAPADTVSRRS